MPSMQHFIFFFPCYNLYSLYTSNKMYTGSHIHVYCVQTWAALLLFTHPGCVSDLNIICSEKLGHNPCMSSNRGVGGVVSNGLPDVRSQPHQPDNNRLRLSYCTLSSPLNSVFSSNTCLYSFQCSEHLLNIITPLWCRMITDLWSGVSKNTKHWRVPWLRAEKLHPTQTCMNALALCSHPGWGHKQQAKSFTKMCSIS